MKIGFNALFLIPGGLAGVGVYATNLISHLTQIAPHHNYTVFVSIEARSSFKDLPDCAQIVTLPSLGRVRPLRVIVEQLILPAYVKYMKLELIHSLGYTGPLLAPCSKITSILDMNYYRWPASFSTSAVIAQKLLVPAIAHNSDHIVTLSQSAKNDIVAALNLLPSKVTPIYLACDRTRFYNMRWSNTDRQRLSQKYNLSYPYILSVATSHPHKNLDGLLQAYALLLRREKVKHTLVLVGHRRKAHDQIIELIRRLNLQDHIVLTGFVPEDDLSLLYAMADVYVFPSFYEGFGLPLLEAMACGVPVVSSNAASLPEVAGDAAMLVDPHNSQTIAEGIFRVLTDKKMRENLVERGLERVKMFSWEKTARETLAVYQMVAGEV